jgi:NADPH:quinone reductase-like Zn-dependent oxidoreductase
MRAIVLEEQKSIELEPLRAMDIKKPEPDGREVRVKVKT